jgi:hypothetical protein
MDHVNLLRQTLKPYLKWHGARLSFVSQFVFCPVLSEFICVS